MAEKQRKLKKKITHAARTQLTLVEHALCPLIPPDGPFTHEAEYFFFKSRNRKRARATVICPKGLKPDDEHYLNLLLGVIFSQQEPNLNFYASASYMLNALGTHSIGGKSVKLLRNSIHRLGAVRYENKTFYDPLRKEYRDVGFGFLSYDLPMEDESSRPWHIAIDPVYFKFCQANGGFLSFSRETYRGLRPASRRLYLLVNKLLYKNRKSGYFDVEHLCINQLGFAQGMRAADYNKKLTRCMVDLTDLGVLTIQGDPTEMCEKVAKGKYRVRFLRGPRFGEKPTTECGKAGDSILALLQSIEGLNATCIRRIASECHRDRIYQWVDATVMARETHGRNYFRKNEAAFFYEGVTSKRQPPNWYFEAKNEAERKASGQLRRHLTDLGFTRSEKEPGDRGEKAFADWLRGEGKADFEKHLEIMGDHRQATNFLRRRFESQTMSNSIDSVGNSFSRMSRRRS